MNKRQSFFSVIYHKTSNSLLWIGYKAVTAVCHSCHLPVGLHQEQVRWAPAVYLSMSHLIHRSVIRGIPAPGSQSGGCGGGRPLIRALHVTVQGITAHSTQYRGWVWYGEGRHMNQMAGVARTGSEVSIDFLMLRAYYMQKCDKKLKQLRNFQKDSFTIKFLSYLCAWIL